MAKVRKQVKGLSMFEFQAIFPDKDAAREYLERVRWPEGICCAHCGDKNVVRSRADAQYFHCRGCRRKFTVRKGSMMERSHVPLDKWLYVMYRMLGSRKGIASTTLSVEMGLRQGTVLSLQKRIRMACGAVKTMLSGEVEVDELYLGGRTRNKHRKQRQSPGGGSRGKSIALGFYAHTGERWIKIIPNTTQDVIHNEIRETVAMGSTLYTDGHKSYRGLWGYEHRVVAHSKNEFVRGKVSTNGIESVWAVFRRGYQGTYHSISPKYLQLYANEFAFRLQATPEGVPTLSAISQLCRQTFSKTTTTSKPLL